MKLLAALMLATLLTACGGGGQPLPLPSPTATPAPHPTLPPSAVSVEMELYAGMLTPAQVATATPTVNLCGPVVDGQATFPNFGAPPAGYYTIYAIATNGPCNGTTATGTTVASGYGSTTVVLGENNVFTVTLQPT